MTTCPEVWQRAFERDDDLRRNHATRSARRSGPATAGLCTAYAEEDTVSAAESTGKTACKA
jgi:hypothetical protein